MNFIIITIKIYNYKFLNFKILRIYLAIEKIQVELLVLINTHPFL